MAAISSISRTSNVVTVNTSTVHGLVVGQAGDVNGVTDTSFNGVFYVVSTPTTSQWTYSQTAANASSSGGTSVPARQVFALNLNSADPGVSSLLCVFWFPVSNPVTRTSFISSVPSGIPHPPTTRDLTALQAGILVEESRSFLFPSSWVQGAKLTNTEQFVQDFYAGRLQALNLLPPPGSVMGFWYDGTGWQQ